MRVGSTNLQINEREVLYQNVAVLTRVCTLSYKGTPGRGSSIVIDGRISDRALDDPINLLLSSDGEPGQLPRSAHKTDKSVHQKQDKQPARADLLPNRPASGSRELLSDFLYHFAHLVEHAGRVGQILEVNHRSHADAEIFQRRLLAVQRRRHRSAHRY